MPYVPFELPDGNDADTILVAMMQRLAARIPGWVPREGHVEWVLLEAAANASAEDRTALAQMDRAQFRHFGEALIRLPRQSGTPATATATFTLSDTLGHTIPAGTQILWDDSNGTRLTLSTVADVVVAPGSGEAAGVTVTADTAGSAGNAITAGPVLVVDGLSFVSSAAITSDATGGTDDETDSEYLDRLAEHLSTFGATAVTAADFAALAKNIPGVGRAVAIDGWSPSANTLDNEKTVGVVIADEEGQPASVAVKAATYTYLQSHREINFIVEVADPAYTVLSVNFTATALTGRDPAVVLENARQAALAYLNAATWGATNGPGTWDTSNVVRLYSLSRAISTADGVAELLTLTINGSAQDVTMTGLVALPSANSTVTGSVL